MTIAQPPARPRGRAAVWVNFIAYQLVWFAAVVAAGHGSPWPGVAGALVFAAAHLAWSPCRRADAQLLAVALACGLAIDGGLAATGWGHYAASAPALPPGGAPLWILALWASFALTLNHSLAYLRAHRAIATALGAAAGPLVYWSAGQAWGALDFAPPAWRGLLWLALGWALAMALLTSLAARTAGVPARQ